MKKNKIFYIVSISLLVLVMCINLFVPNNFILQTIGILDLVTIAIYSFSKEKNLYKVLTISIIVSIVLGYFIPSTSVNYGAAEKGAINPVTLVDSFIDLVYNANVFIPTFIYILVIGAFYAVLYKTKNYDNLVNNVAAKFNKNKGLFIVLTVFTFGLVTFFTGEMYSMLLFVPFFISVVRKLGFSKETSVIATIGAILLGNASTLYTYHANQILSLTVKDNVLTKVILILVLLVSLIAFILVFTKKPESTKELKKEKAKVAPIHVAMGLLFVLLILGFVNWNGYFGFDGFDKFLETLRKGEIAHVSIFNIIVGSTIAAFGTWQVFHLAALLVFTSVVIALIYKVKINDFFEAYAEGIKKAFPYAMILLLANMVLVNVAYSGIFYTMVVGLTKKTISLLTGSLTAVLAAFFAPDSINATQFALYSATLTKATNYQNLLGVIFQAVYNLFLLISPTSVLLFIGLKYTDTKYKDWIKYIYKFFIVLFVIVLLVITIGVEGFKTTNIVALVLFVIAIILICYLRVSKVTKKVTNSAKIEVKAEPKKVETTSKKTTKKNSTTKKTNSKKSK